MPDILRSLGLAKGARPRFSYYLGLIFNRFSKIIKALHNILFTLKISQEDSQRARTVNEGTKVQSSQTYVLHPTLSPGPTQGLGHWMPVITGRSCCPISAIKNKVVLCFCLKLSLYITGTSSSLISDSLLWLKTTK